jgi:pyruvate/2-oxoglutarate/acetoin dehydrogenase E1 component
VRISNPARRLISVAQGWPQYCIGSETIYAINEDTAFLYLDEPVICLPSVDISMPYAQVLEEMSIPRPPDVVGVVKKMLNVSMVLQLLCV